MKIMAKSLPERFLHNIANFLTVSRAVLAIVVVVTIFYDTSVTCRLTALVMFIVAALTDWWDGYFARKYKSITNFGTMADPIADKMLVGFVIFALSYLGELSWWSTSAIIVRDLVITTLRFTLPSDTLPVNMGGKVKTAIQMIAISLYLMPGVPSCLRSFCIVVAVLFTVGTGIYYAKQAYCRSIHHYLVRLTNT